MRYWIITIFLSLVCSQLWGQQSVTGTVYDENRQPIPFATVYVKNDADQRTVADVNGQFQFRLMPGEYYLVFTYLGYEPREVYIPMRDADVQQNVQLFPLKITELKDMEASAKKSNPGREIMLKVVERRDTINPWRYPHSVEVYTRATEKILRESDERKKKREDEEKIMDPTGTEDPFAESVKKDEQLARNMNMTEINLTRHYAPPNKVKEFRNGYENRGSTRNLYYLTTVKSNFNFFENLLHLDDLHQTPVASPISGPGILSYKYRLEDQYEENGRKIHKIKIIPRLSSTSTLSGYIYVIDSIWMIQKLSLTLEKGNLLLYDYFTVEQSFANQGDTLNVLTQQKLLYGVRWKDLESDCNTFTEFKSYQFQPQFADKFFNNELSVTEKEAYERDSTYWKAQRGYELTPEEQRYILVKDSIEQAHNKKEYLDSVDAVFNKITLMKVLWFGIDHRNRENRTQWGFSSVAAFVRPLYIAGPRIAPGFSYFKKWENERYLDTYTEVTYGLLNNDIKGNLWGAYRYDPFHFGTINFSFNHDFDVIRSFDAITQIYKRSNFIETTSLNLGHFRELKNGLYFDADFEFSERRDVREYEFVRLFDDAIPNEEPTDFTTYQALIGTFTLSWVPAQKYMREPYRKVVLGSKWPTFYIQYERGVPRLFGSDVDHEYGLVGIRQTFKIGTIGTSSYHVMSGQFLSSRQLYDADFRYHRRSDPFWFSNPLFSFQDLDSALPSKQIYYEAHLVHHDNGAILNKIPFWKKTGIGLVVGTGALYVKEFDWQHYEAFAGLERNFKFSRRKLRVGIYGVISDGNKIKTTTTWKISFAVLDLRNMKFNF